MINIWKLCGEVELTCFDVVMKEIGEIVEDAIIIFDYNMQL